MPIPVKQPININFQGGLNLKPDPYQVPVGNFLSLVNTVFDSVGRLTKRNGFPYLTPLPNNTTSYLTTFSGDLQAIGEDILAYSSGTDLWVDKGSVYPLELSTMPLIRNGIGQTQSDIAISSNGLICTVYTETNGTTVKYKYSIADAVTGQNILEPVTINTASTTYGTPRVFIVGLYFIILYTSGTSPYVLNYIAIPYEDVLSAPTTAQVAASYTPSTTLAFDAILVNGNALMIAYAEGSTVKAVSLSSTLVLSTTLVVDAAHGGTIFTMAVDDNLAHVWITYYSGSTAYTAVITNTLVSVLPPTLTIASASVANMASYTINGVMSLFYEIINAYTYDASIPTNYIEGNTLTVGGTLGTPKTIIRSVGLASKANAVNGIIYFLATYQSPYQDTYFLIDGSLSISPAPIVVAKLAYSNGGGYLLTGLPNLLLNDTTLQTSYLYKDLLEAQAQPAVQSIGIAPPAVYTQTGINLASFDITTDGLVGVEMASTLNLSGGFLWSYDGYIPVEQNFFLFPDSVEAVWTAGAPGGNVAAQPNGSTNTDAYYYQVVYEWTDNQGNLMRSPPSIPLPVTTTGSGVGSIILNIPTLRLTYKVTTPVNIVIYRWSIANQTYYQVTSITQPLQNSPIIDSVSYVDDLADSAIIGNNIIYTTGGVVDDINGPASNILTLFDDRVWLVDAEDPNLLWYSKQVIEATPVEMSEFFTFYVAPSTGAQGSTGYITALAPMDDKLIIFKKDAIYYINGTGPDNTGANNNYSQPIFITSTVGTSNIRSIVLMPMGLMFQSDKGIWLLGRDLNTSYIGAPVEGFNTATVTSAIAVPATNQVRFGLDTGVTLLYDYFVQQWGEFQGIPSVSATLYQDLHTIVNQYGQVSQETAGTYLDGTVPVLMSFTTSWLQLAGLRGYMRAYWVYLLGTFLSPHKLNCSIAYDYNSSPVQTDLISPPNYAGPYGSDPYYGGDGSSGYGVPPQEGSIEQNRIFLQRQRCRAFQINMQEVFDPTYGTVAGPGLTLSGLNCIVGVKKAYAPIQSSNQYG